LKGNKLIIASSNKGKISEFQEILPNFECIPQSSFNISDVKETGKNFEENAILKAKNAFSKTNISSIGDDSGLIVPQINNEPGLYSARYSGVNATDSDNRNKLISKLKDKKLESTYAYFFCCIVAVGVKDQNKIIVCSGKVEGEVRTIERGEKGFGYDSMFYPKGYSESFAELNSLEKNKISHRGIALKKLMEKLN
tara:strand:+ start:186 stop:773 length:588 start_codon:yes stop_codon:yes gene_type:complete